MMKIATPEPFVPPPRIGQLPVLALGFAVYLLGLVWPVVVLATALLLSLFIPYCFRTTDHPEERRRLYREYQKSQHPMIQKVLAVPENVDLEEKYWINSRGMALCTATMRPKHREPKCVLFFCHGFGDHVSFLKRHNLFRFVNEGIAVATIEYEGHGRSDGPLGLIPDFNQLVDDVVDFFQEVSDLYFPEKKCFLMGESMGGAVSFLVWKKRPSLFSGMIFVAPMCKISDALKPPQWVIDLLSKIVGPIGSNGYIGYLPIAPTQADLDNLCNKDVIMKDLCKSTPFLDDRSPRLTTARELLHAASSVSSELDSFDAPFLIQHGKADKVTDPRLSQALYDVAKSKDKTIKLYDGMYHSLMADVPSETTMVLNDSIQWVLKRAH